MAKASRKGMKAYVLIETAPGKTKSVKRSLGRVTGGASTMVHLDAITGPYDFIAVVEGPSLDAIGRLVTDEIGTIDGVTRTTTCVTLAMA
jgi:DNA-binding Lrp family transcriptional regulator